MSSRIQEGREPRKRHAFYRVKETGGKEYKVVDKEELKKFFEERGYFLDDKILDLLATTLNVKMNENDPVRAFLLVGAPGSGKSTLPKLLADYLDAEFYFMQITPGASEEDLFYQIIPDENSKSGFRLVERPLIQALRDSWYKPVVLLVDEIDKANPKVDAFFLTYLQEGAVNLGIRGSDKKGVVKGNKDNLIVFFTSNMMRDLQEPLQRRLITIKMPPMSTYLVYKNLLANGINERVAGLVAEIYNVMRYLSEKGRIQKHPSYNEALQAARVLNEMVGEDGFMPSDELTAVLYTMMVKNDEDMQTLINFLKSDEYEKIKGEWIVDTSMQVPGLEEDILSLLPERATLRIESQELARKRARLPSLALDTSTEIEKSLLQPEEKEVEISEEELLHYPVFVATKDSLSGYIMATLTRKFNVTPQIYSDLIILNDIVEDGKINYILAPKIIEKLWGGFRIPVLVNEPYMNEHIDARRAIPELAQLGALRVNADVYDTGELTAIEILMNDDVRRERGMPNDGLDYRILVDVPSGRMRVEYRYRGASKKNVEEEMRGVYKKMWNVLSTLHKALNPDLYAGLIDLLANDKYHITARTIAYVLANAALDKLEEERGESGEQKPLLTDRQLEELIDSLAVTVLPQVRSIDAQLIADSLSIIERTGHITPETMSRVLFRLVMDSIKNLRENLVPTTDVVEERLHHAGVDKELIQKITTGIKETLNILADMAENKEAYLPRTESATVIESLNDARKYFTLAFYNAIADIGYTLWYLMDATGTYNAILPPVDTQDKTIQSLKNRLGILYQLIYGTSLPEDMKWAGTGFLINKQDLKQFLESLEPQEETGQEQTQEAEAQEASQEEE